MNPAQAGVDAVAPEQVRRAAGAAVALLPVPAGAVVEPAAVAEIPADRPVVVQRFTGTPSGWCAVVLDPATVEGLLAALAEARGGPGDGADLPAACDPALRAATAELGPVAALDPEPTTLGALAGAPDAAAVRLAVDGVAVAHVLLWLQPGGTVPGPRRSPDPSSAPARGGDAATGHGLELLRSVPMEVTAEIGRTRMTIQELLALTPGAVVELDRPVGSPADVLVNGRLFARGEVVVVDEDFAIRITEIVDTTESPGA